MVVDPTLKRLGVGIPGVPIDGGSSVAAEVNGVVGGGSRRSCRLGSAGSAVDASFGITTTGNCGAVNWSGSSGAFSNDEDVLITGSAEKGSRRTE